MKEHVVVLRVYTQNSAALLIALTVFIAHL
jgi:hypothetical protein